MQLIIKEIRETKKLTQDEVVELSHFPSQSHHQQE